MVLLGPLTYAQEQGLGNVLDVAAFVNADEICVELCGSVELVARLCKLNMLQLVSYGRYSIHRMLQQVAHQDCLSGKAIKALWYVLKLVRRKRRSGGSTIFDRFFDRVEDSQGRKGT